MTTTTEQFSLRWNNFHSNLTSGFHELLQASEMVDVTLAVDGQFFQAHKIVLSICSPYFKQMFKVNPCKHPIVILKDVAHENMKDILEFMYMGEVNVLRDNLSAFLKTAELLQVKGLTGDDSSETSSRRDDKCESICDNEEDADFNFTQMIDSEMELPSDYSTSRVLTPPPQSQSTNQPSVQNIKRHSKLSTHPNSNCKRTKVDNHKNRNEQNNVIKNIKTEKNDTEQTETSHVALDKSEELPECVVNDSYKHILESNTLTPTATSAVDQGSNEQDVLLYAVDQKHVYCPYCCRKFVNRYNLKVHIRDKHDESPIALDCLICGKTMRNRSCLRVHMYHHRKQQLENTAAAAPIERRENDTGFVNALISPQNL